MSDWIPEVPASEPLRVLPDRGVRDEAVALDRIGHVLVYGRVEDWCPEFVDDPVAVRRLLGDESARFERIAHPLVRRRFAASRVLMRHAAARAAGAEPGDFEVAREPGGRPYLRGLTGLDVNVSHTGQIVVAGISRSGPIGVDVESTTRRLQGLEIADRACSPFERAVLENLPAGRRHGYLIRLWTLKESYSKALGLGLRLPFRDFGFDLDPEAVSARLLSGDGLRPEDERWRFESHGLEGRYAVGLAVAPDALGEGASTAREPVLDDTLLAAVLGSLGD